MGKVTVEGVLAGMDAANVTVAELKAFAEEQKLIYPEGGTKAEVLADLADQLAARASDGEGGGVEDIPDAPPEPGEEDGYGPDDDVPDALRRRGLQKRKRIVRKAAKLPKDAPPAIKRRWAG